MGVRSYAVLAGDTLRSIAQSMYGTASLWWKIADANGLLGDAGLQAGQVLSIPGQAGGAVNSAGDFRVYDASQIVGDTSPTMPAPPPQKKGCGILGKLIMIVVAIVVAAYAPTFLPEVLKTNAIVMGAASAAAGSIASQMVGLAIGAIDEFSWKSVAMAAIGGGVGAGLGDSVFGLKPGDLVNTVAKAMVQNAITQGIGVVTGLQDKFSWSGVAAAGLGAGVGQAVSESFLGVPGTDKYVRYDDEGNLLPGAASYEGGRYYASDAANKIGVYGNSMGANLGKHMANFAGGMLSGLAAGVATAVARGGRVSVTQIATDAFGNALGDAFVQELGSGGSQQQEKIKQERLLQEREDARDAEMARLLGLGSEPVTPTPSPSDVNMGSGSGIRLRLGSGQPGLRMTPEAAKAFDDGIDAVRSGRYDDQNITNGIDTAVDPLDEMNGQKLQVVFRPGARQDAASKLPIVPEQLRALQDPAVLADPVAMRKLYSVAMQNTRTWAPLSLTPEEMSLTTTLAYQEVFRQDPGAVWFGLAPYATTKVGETYAQLSKVGFIAAGDVSIIREGFRQGNRAIFESMFTAEQFYQAGGTAAIRAMVAIDRGSFGANWTDTNLEYGRALVNSFVLRDSARDAFQSGRAGQGEELLAQSLRASADFEQRVVLQHFYDKSYVSDPIFGSPVSKTLRQSIQDAFKIPERDTNSSWSQRPGFNLLVETYGRYASTVTINGKATSFSGRDVGNVDQRMPFVYSLANDLMQTYSSNGNWLNGHQRIYQDQNNVMNRVFGDQAIWNTRQRLGLVR